MTLDALGSRRVGLHCMMNMIMVPFYGWMEQIKQNLNIATGRMVRYANSEVDPVFVAQIAQAHLNSIGG